MLVSIYVYRLIVATGYIGKSKDSFIGKYFCVEFPPPPPPSVPKFDDLLAFRNSLTFDSEFYTLFPEFYVQGKV